MPRGEQINPRLSIAEVCASTAATGNVRIFVVPLRPRGRPGNGRRSGSMGIPRTLPVAAGATRYHSAMLSASADLLATVATPMPYGVQLGTVARDGTGVRLSPRRPQNWPRLSPDGRRMARQIVDPARGNPDIWVEDLQDGSLVRVTTATGRHPAGLVSGWAAAGIRIRHAERAAAQHRGGRWHRRAQELPCPRHIVSRPTGLPRALSHRQFTATMNGAHRDVWSVSLEPGGSPKAILSGPFPEYHARISPDGQWLAYVSEEAGGPEVSVRRYRVSRSVSWSPAMAATNRCGVAMGTSSLRDRDGRLLGRSVRRQPTGELTLGAANP